jgi:hypothetical protein
MSWDSSGLDIAPHVVRKPKRQTAKSDNHKQSLNQREQHCRSPVLNQLHDIANVPEAGFQPCDHRGRHPNR